MNFEPLTEIYFCHTGIDEQNKVVCDAQSTTFNVVAGGQNLKGTANASSFQREGPFFIIRIDHNSIPYYDLLQCDTIIFKNEEYTRAFWTVGNIIGVEWKNPNCSFVRYKIDHFMTYQTFIDWESTIAYIEREHVKADWASDGETPLYTNIGPYEDFNVTPDTPIFHYEKTFTPDKVLIHSPYGEDGKPVFNGALNGNLFTSLQSPIKTPDAANSYFETIADEKDASINNIVGVYGVPNEFATPIQADQAQFTFQEYLDPVFKESANQSTFPIKYRNAKCWAAPFATVKLFSSEGSFVEFTPQWFGNNVQKFLFKCKACGAGKQFAGAMATMDNQNGTFKWENWTDFCVMLSELPKCPWTADGFREWNTINSGAVLGRELSALVHGITGIISGIGTAVSTGTTPGAEFGNKVAGVGQVVNSVVDAGAKIASIQATINAAKASGATVQGTGSYGTLFDVGQNAWGFKVVYYVVQNYIMRSIDDFFDRYGYKVNKMGKLGINNRPIWNFIKTSECHVNSKIRGVPFVSEMAINNMFDAGVTLWNAEKYIGGRKIGDFSNPEENRGIGG